VLPKDRAAYFARQPTRLQRGARRVFLGVAVAVLASGCINVIEGVVRSSDGEIAGAAMISLSGIGLVLARASMTQVGLIHLLSAAGAAWLAWMLYGGAWAPAARSSQQIQQEFVFLTQTILVVGPFVMIGLVAGAALLVAHVAREVRRWYF
jgi:hypothetical protein